MLFTDLTLSSPLENILCDEVLLHLAEEGHRAEVLRFWESPEVFIVLGKTGETHQDLKTATVINDKIPVLRRCSGGGTVVQGQGCLNFTLVLSKDRPEMATIHRSYRHILGTIVEVLGRLGVPAIFRPISDLAVVDGEKKFSGNAQRRGRRFILHHGTILHNFDLVLIERYLNIPKDIPDYRRERPHLDFVTNISLDVAKFKEMMAQAIGFSPGPWVWDERETRMLRDFAQKKNVLVQL